jgi:hypothetical protein
MAFRLSPEFGDGFMNTIVKTKSELLELVGMWADEASNYPEEPATIEYVEMSDKEIDALPDM